MSRFQLSIVALVAALLPIARASAEPRERLAVLGLKANGVDESMAAALGGLLNTEVTRLERYDVVGEEDVKSLVAAASVAQALGCEGATCAADLSSLGQTLNAGLLVAGTVGKVGESHLLNLTLLDARQSKPVNRASVTAQTAGELTPALRGAVLSLFRIAGQLVLWNQPAGAQVLLNDKLVGVAPVRKIDLPREGEHTVRVFRDDATPFEAKVVIKAGDTVRLRVESHTFADLEAWRDERRSTGTWLTVGGGLALAGAGALYLLALDSDARLSGLDARRPEDQARGAEIASTTFGYVVGSTAALLAGLGLSGMGGYMLAVNPWQDLLEEHAGGVRVAVGGGF